MVVVGEIVCAISIQEKHRKVAKRTCDRHTKKPSKQNPFSTREQTKLADNSNKPIHLLSTYTRNLGHCCFRIRKESKAASEEAQQGKHQASTGGAMRK